MSLYPRLKEKTTEKKQIITYSKKSYILTIRESDTSTLLYIGGIYRYCLECQIFAKDSFMSRFTDIYIADLPHLYYNEECAIRGEKFMRGIDTKIILRLLISYLHETYPYIRGVKFIDKSVRECANGYTVDLAVFYFLQYGKTWYQSTFGAVFAEEKDRIEFEKQVLLFNRLKNTMKWADINAVITSSLPLPSEEMKKLFEETTTWQEFFVGIRDRIGGAAEICEFMAPWIGRFSTLFMKFGFETKPFIIPIHADLLIPFQIQNSALMSNGGRTRKNGRKRLQNLQ